MVRVLYRILGAFAAIPILRNSPHPAFGHLLPAARGEGLCRERPRDVTGTF